MSNDPLKKPLGPTGETVRANVIRLRAERRMGYTELSEKLKDIGRHILPIGLRRIESGARRVDVDDLVALAQVLKVAPTTLLTPWVAYGTDQVAVTGVDGGLSAAQLWDRLRADEPIDPDADVVAFLLTALPNWKKLELVDKLNLTIRPAGTAKETR